MPSRQDIRQSIEAELGHVSDVDLAAAINRGINWARRELTELKGGKLKFLRTWGTISLTANARYSELPADCRQTFFVYDTDNAAEVEFQDEHAYRRDSDNFGYQPDTNLGTPETFLTDAPISSNGRKQVEWVPIPNTGRTWRIGYWRTLADLDATADTAEIADIPREHHAAIEAGARFYAMRHVTATPDVLGMARTEWRDAKDKVQAREDDTVLRLLRRQSWAEVLRVEHRQALGVPRGEY